MDNSASPCEAAGRVPVGARFKPELAAPAFHEWCGRQKPGNLHKPEASNTGRLREQGCDFRPQAFGTGVAGGPLSIDQIDLQRVVGGLAERLDVLPPLNPTGPQDDRTGRIRDRHFVRLGPTC